MGRAPCGSRTSQLRPWRSQRCATGGGARKPPGSGEATGKAGGFFEATVLVYLKVGEVRNTVKGWISIYHYLKHELVGSPSQMWENLSPQVATSVGSVRCSHL